MDEPKVEHGNDISEGDIVSHPRFTRASFGIPEGITYLAGPYSDPLPAVMDWRYHTLTKYAAELTGKGYNVFSPITNSHEMAAFIHPEKATSWDFWSRVDEVFIANSQLMIILCMEGWQESVGVTAEQGLAFKWRVPIEYHDMNGVCIRSASRLDS